VLRFRRAENRAESSPPSSVSAVAVRFFRNLVRKKDNRIAGRESARSCGFAHSIVELDQRRIDQRFQLRLAFPSRDTFLQTSGTGNYPRRRIEYRESIRLSEEVFISHVARRQVTAR